MAGASTINVHHQPTASCNYLPGDIVYRVHQGQLEIGVVRKGQKDGKPLGEPASKQCNNNQNVDEDDEVMVVLETSKKGLSAEKSTKELIIAQNDNLGSLDTGMITVSWFPDGYCEVLSTDKIHLMDRSVRLGEAVKFIDPTENQFIGYCKRIHRKLCLKINGTNTVIENVNSEDLELLYPVRIGDICFYKSWIGCIENFSLAITLQSKDGSLLVLNNQDLCNFDETKEYSSKLYRSKDFHVGQKLIGPRRDLLKGTWIHRTLEMKMPLSAQSSCKESIELTVTKVRVDTVSCKWIYCTNAVTDDGSDGNLKVQESAKSEPGESNIHHTPKPQETLGGKQLLELKVIDYFHKFNIKVGDTGYYEIKNSDKLIDLDHFVESFHEEKQRGGINKLADWDKPFDQYEMFYDDSSMTDEEENFEYDDFSEDDDDFMDFEQTSASSSPPLNKKVIPTEQTASTSASTEISGPDLPDFFVQSTPEKAVDPAPPRRKTAVQVIATETKGDVVWRSNQTTNDILSSRLHTIHHLPDHHFLPGSLVIDNKGGISSHDFGVVQEFHPDSSIALVKWFKSKALGVKPSLHSEEWVGTYDIKLHPTYNCRTGSCVVRIDETSKDSYFANLVSNVGQIVECDIDGQILCVWANNTLSHVHPQDLCIVKNTCQYFDDLENNEGTMMLMHGMGLPNRFKETDTNLPQSTRVKRKMPSINGSSETLVEKIQISAHQLEDYFIQNPFPTYQNSISIMHRIYKLAHLCKSLDETVGTSLVSSDSFRSLLQQVNQNPSAPPGPILMIGNQLRKLLKSSTSSQSSWLEKNESSSSDDLSDESYHENLIEALIEELNTSNNSNASSEINLAIDIPSCLEFLKQFKTSFSSVISNLQPKKVHVTEPDIEIVYQSHDPDAPSTSSGVGILAGQKRPDKAKESKEEKIPTVASPSTGADMQSMKDVWQMAFVAPACHKFISSTAQPTDQMIRILRREIFLLKSSLPPDIYVKAFEDRLDLFSAMIKGPQGTPYEDALFLFDIYLPATYPKVPPKVHYLSYCSDRLNPNLYTCGKVCVSLLGTWSGKGNEMWNSKGSNLLQLLLSIQALILVPEPYFNEPGFESQKGTATGRNNSKAYNEKAVLKTVQSMTNMLNNPHEPFKIEIYRHCKARAKNFIDRIETWISISEEWNKARGEYKFGIKQSDGDKRADRKATGSKQISKPIDKFKELLDFPLLPATSVFCSSVSQALNEFKKKLSSLNIEFT